MTWAALIIPPDLGTSVTLVLFGASFVASFIATTFGIGGGALLLAVMAALMPPAVLIPVHGIVQLGSNASRAAAMILHFVNWRDLGAFTAGSVVGVAIGGMIVINISPAWVQLGVAVFIVWSIFVRPPAWLRHWPVLTGGFSSFLTMFFGASGLFVASYTKSLALDRHKHVATHASLMTVQHLLKTLAFGFLGFSFGPWLGFTIAMIAAGLAGTLAGRLALNRLTDARFKTALDVLLLLIAARLFWAGLQAL